VGAVNQYVQTTLVPLAGTTIVELNVDVPGTHLRRITAFSGSPRALTPR